FLGTPSNYYDPPKEANDWFVPYEMTLQAKGVWHVRVEGNLHGAYYNYVVTNSAGANEVVDPYAKSAGINGVRGQVVNFDDPSVIPEGWDAIPDVWDGVEGYDIEHPTDLTVYEVHVRDLTSDDSWGGTPEKAGKFAGFIEKGTTYTEGEVTVKTGFDHIEELGVNAVQILPFYDNDNNEAAPSYNWGYNPTNFNVVEGGYSLNPTNGLLRVKEFREVVQAFATNANKTRIIMDVVYNHVASVASSNLTKIMPKYYFRTNLDGSYTNASGVGNDTKSEAPMMRKLIVDSVKFWAETYKIKGFRFDLMGLIDVETMRQVKDVLHGVDPDFVTYGEGWAGFSGSSSSNPSDTGNVYSKLNPTTTSPGILGAFNDKGRNAIRGGNDQGWGGPPLPGYGFISQSDASAETKTTVANMLKGWHGDNKIIGANPYQTVNYASCHDNYTLFDQLNYTLGDGTGAVEPSIYDVAAASVAVNSTVIMSQGIAFLHAGEEIFRTKVEMTVAENAALPEEERLVPYDPAHPELKEFADPVVTMYGYIVSHNSYKSPDRTNSFKYERKVQLLNYFNKYKEAVHARSYVSRYAYAADTSGFMATWVSGNAIGLWVKGSGTNAEICYFVNGRTTGSINFASAASSTLRFDSLSWYTGGSYNISGTSLTFNQKYTSLLFTI
ncbi:MAG: hypothetical protein WC282_02975, partial [Bacilli bacterium]